MKRKKFKRRRKIEVNVSSNKAEKITVNASSARLTTTVENKSRYDLIIVFLTFLIPFVVYFLTLNPTVSVFTDSGEFPYAAYVTGFAHPPGYPLYIMAVKLFQFLPFGNPAFLANLTSAFFGAATISVFYLFLKNVAKSRVVAFSSAGILAFTTVFWINSVVSEVFTLVAFLIVSLYYFFALWVKTNSKKYFYLVAFLAGLCFFYHQITIIPLAGLFLWFVASFTWKKLSIKNYLVSVLLFTLGFLPYIYVLIVAQGSFALEWENPNNLQSLLRLVSRSTYGTFTLTNSGASVMVDRQIFGLFDMWLQNILSLLIFPVFIGVYQLWKQNKGLLVASLTSIVGILAFSVVSGMPIYVPSQIPYLERFQVIALIFICILMGFGFVFILNWIKTINIRFLKVTSILLLLLPLVFILASFSKVSQSGNYFGENLASDIFATVPTGSIIFSEDDSVINSLLYNHYVLGQRPDVKLFVTGMFHPNSEWYIQELKQLYPEIKFPPAAAQDYLGEFLVLNADTPIFFQLSNVYYGRRVNFPVIRRGILWQFNPGDLTNDTPEEMLKHLGKYKNIELVKEKKFVPGTPEYSYAHLYTDALLYMGEITVEDIKVSEKYFKEAMGISSESYIPNLLLGDVYERHGKFDSAIEEWESTLKLSENMPQETKSLIQEKIEFYNSQNQK